AAVQAVPCSYIRVIRGKCFTPPLSALYGSTIIANARDLVIPVKLARLPTSSRYFSVFNKSFLYTHYLTDKNTGELIINKDN
ncbi:hypothetical protein QUV58_10490, partial [Succinatimonas hippei]|uniref:hypothetical protein n=1 Tax=Succinatimonas hippei TaxID=626938 RepID=UPI0025A3B461